MFPIYLILGDQNFLVDSAISAKAKEIHTKIEEVFNNNDIPHKVIHQILLTHSHYDHTGACSYLQDIYNLSVAGSFRTIELLKKPKVVDFINRLNLDFKKILKDDSDVTCSMLNDLKGLAEGDQIKINDLQYLEVYDTPGHTKCSVSYFLLPDRILFPGDSVGVFERDQSIKPLFLSSYKNYENSLKKIMDLKPRVLGFAHNKYLKGEDKVSEYLENSMRSTQKAKEDILDSLKKSQNFKKIAEDILAKEFPLPTIMGPREAFLINLTAMVKTVYNEFVKQD
jgi:glyoxylase-like metal-dependent hydrolase (beta-lactamase superfamily II)